MNSHGFHHHHETTVPVLVSLAAAALVGFAWIAAMVAIVFHLQF